MIESLSFLNIQAALPVTDSLPKNVRSQDRSRVVLANLPQGEAETLALAGAVAVQLPTRKRGAVTGDAGFGARSAKHASEATVNSAPSAKTWSNTEVQAK